MIDYKLPEEVGIMKRGGKILSEALWEVLGHAKPGVTELELDALADRLIRDKGGEPGFKRVKGWKHAICVSTNDVIVHGVPTNYGFKEGDVVGVDCGVFLDGFHTDMSETKIVKATTRVVGVPVVGTQTEAFLKIGKRALNEAIKAAKPGNRIGDISRTIQDIVEKQGGYSVTRSLIGHGVGRELHEEPEVPGYVVTKREKTPLLKAGMTIAIEVIYTMGKADVVLDRDGWTIRTKDGSLAGLYERTVAITKDGNIILTP